MDGFECARSFRAWERSNCRISDRKLGRHHKHQPICIVSSHTGEEEKARCIEIGVDFYESKPAKVADLARITEICKSNQLNC